MTAFVFIELYDSVYLFDEFFPGQIVGGGPVIAEGMNGKFIKEAHGLIPQAFLKNLEDVAIGAPRYPAPASFLTGFVYAAGVGDTLCLYGVIVKNLKVIWVEFTFSYEHAFFEFGSCFSYAVSLKHKPLVVGIPNYFTACVFQPAAHDTGNEDNG
ncbi:MAG: hypothetical protein BWX77_00258 [Bacteroidetes bacterium ADurb.Bin090]|nr:MAG: hypothetical protein BWX77_00258 [Bacteroidetes bacterium ADurb.Bin090]